MDKLIVIDIEEVKRILSEMKEVLAGIKQLRSNAIDDLMSIENFAALSRLTERTAKNNLQKSKIPIYRIGSKFFSRSQNTNYNCQRCEINQ